MRANPYTCSHKKAAHSDLSEKVLYCPECWSFVRNDETREVVSTAYDPDHHFIPPEKVWPNGPGV